MDKLAIVVPCYNEEEVLKIASEALRGVLQDLIRKGKITEDRCTLKKGIRLSLPPDAVHNITTALEFVDHLFDNVHVVLQIRID